jgi:hypothetical protein
MSKTTFKPVLNEQTGKTDFNFPATLKSIGTSVLKLNNAKQTEYVVGTIDFTYPNGTPAVGVTTQIFKKSLDHGITVDSTLLSTLSLGDDGKMYIRTSHLVAGNNVDTEAFASLFNEVAEPVANDA